MKSLLSLFPNASKDCQDANSATVTLPANKNALQVTAGGKKRHSMNKTEAEFALILEAQKRKGEILRYEYEGITLRFAGVKYTPDFVVFEPTTTTMRYGHEFITRMKLIEIKGAFTKGKFERAIERFRHARTYWPEFQFEMWQKQQTGWKQIE